jgi:hypothetical protein
MSNPANRYDESDIVRRVFLMNASGLKFATYQVRDMAAKALGVDKFSSPQHHLTYVPVSFFGEGEDKRALVNEIGATIYAMLEDEQVEHLREVIEKIKADGDAFEPRAYIDLEKSRTVIQAYLHPTTGKVELQILRGSQILGVLTLATAEMFCSLAGRANNPPGPDQRAQRNQASAIAGEVDKAMSAPAEEIDPATLDGEA